MIRTFNVTEVIEKDVVRFGNGSIVYTPKKWIGEKAIVILEKKPLNATEEILKTLKPHLAEIQGIYLFGSHARNEQTKDSDIDVLVVSDHLKIKNTGKLRFTAASKEKLLEHIKKDWTLFSFQMIKEARPVFNQQLLEELKQTKTSPDFKQFFNSTLEAFKKVEHILKLDRKKGKKIVKSPAAIYSLILRLRTMFLMHIYFRKEDFSNAKFREYLKKNGLEEKTINEFLEIYRQERNDEQTKQKIALKDIEQLFKIAKTEFLKTEKIVEKWAERKK